MKAFTRRLKKVLVIAICLATLLLTLFLYYQSFRKPRSDAPKEMSNMLEIAVADLEVKGFIEQHSIGFHKTKDFYGIERFLLPEVANYYLDRDVSVKELSGQLKSKGWHVKSQVTKEGFCSKNSTQASLFLCIRIDGKLKEDDLIGGGDTLFVGHDNYREIKTPYNVKISIIETQQREKR